MHRVVDFSGVCRDDLWKGNGEKLVAARGMNSRGAFSMRSEQVTRACFFRFLSRIRGYIVTLFRARYLDEAGRLGVTK